MNYYRQLFYSNRFLLWSFLSLVVWFYILPLDADAQQVYDVSITNGSIDVNIADPTDLFNSGFDANELNAINIQVGDDSPMFENTYNGFSAYSSSYGDYMDTSYSQPVSTSYNPLAITWSGRSPSGLSGRYFNLSGLHWSPWSRASYNFNTTPLETNKENGDNNDYKLRLHESFIKPSTSLQSNFFYYNTFKSDVLSAFFGTDNLVFYYRILQILQATPTSSNFTYHVPSIFGFDAGFTIDIPIHDILHGSGSWYSFSNVIGLLRSMMSFIYYYCVTILIVRCIFIYN